MKVSLLVDVHDVLDNTTGEPLITQAYPNIKRDSVLARFRIHFDIPDRLIGIDGELHGVPEAVDEEASDD